MNYASSRIRVSCCNCHKETSLININNHYNACIKKVEIIKVCHDDLKCQFCGKEYFLYKPFLTHELICSENPDRIEKTKRKNVSNQYIKAKNLGLPPPEISEETRNKISLASTGRIKTLEQRKILSEAMKLAVKNNPDSYTKNNVAGRVKSIDYNGIKLKGSWEVTTAQWLDSLNIVWISEINPHVYYWNDNWHQYFPDFFLPDYNSYIEVKGYKTERDDAKWAQFEDKLIIVDKRNINKLNEFQSIEALSEMYSFN